MIPPEPNAVNVLAPESSIATDAILATDGELTPAALRALEESLRPSLSRRSLDEDLIRRQAPGPETMLSKVHAALYLSISLNTFARSVERVVPSVVDTSGVMYRIADLDRWLQRRAAARKGGRGTRIASRS